MSLPLTTLYRKLSSKDQARIRRHIANPVLFLLEEYHDLSPAEQKKFKSSIGVDQKNKITKAEVKETSTTKETTVAKESTPAKDTPAKDDSVTEVQNGIESMDLDGLTPAITQPSKVEPKAADNQVVPYQAPSSETKVTPPKPDAAKGDDTDTDEDPEPKYNSDEDQDYAEDPEDEEGEDEY
jgi:hypothetical protein